MYSCNNRRGSQGYQTFWIIVVIALFLIWITYLNNDNGSCGCGGGCGDNNDCGCYN